MDQPKPATGLSRRSMLRHAGAAALAAALPGAARGQRPRRPPNILFILADDLGYADLGCYGRRDYATPVVDRLAREGALLTQAYSNSAVCTPTRVALITGRYHQRVPVGLFEPLTGTEEDAGLPDSRTLLPQVFRSAGYATSLVGKWHMGWPPEHGPLRSGYDRFFGIAPGAADYFTHTYGDPRREVLYEGEAPVERSGYLTDLLADRAVHEIREHAAARRPFLLSLHFNAPHWPWEGPGDQAVSATLANLRHNDGGSLETFGEMVAAMDRAVGRVLAELERSGTAEDTIVVFTSDNGGERFSDTWPLRGGKGELLEGGIRVPLIVRWPGRIRRGTRSAQVMMTMDWLPTLAAAAGIALPADASLDGQDLTEVLAGTAPVRPRRLFWRFRAGGQAAVRDGDWKYLRIRDQEFLYDVARDPRERADLKLRQPEVFERLERDWEAWNRDMLPYPPPAA